MNLQELNPPLSDPVQSLVGLVTMQANLMMGSREIPPHAFLLDGVEIDVVSIMEMTEESKPGVFQWLHDQREKYTAVLFLTEAWTTRYALEEPKELGGLNKVPEPRLDPRREEAAIAVLYVGNRVIQFNAPINRIEGQAPTLGEWEVRNDSGKGDLATGRLMAPVRRN